MIFPSHFSDPGLNKKFITASAVPDRWLLVVRGVVQINVEDQEGRFIGPVRDPDYPNLIVNQIPGASYKPGKLFSSLFLNEHGVYIFTFIAHAPSNVHIFLSLSNDVSKLFTFFFQGVTITERSNVRLVFDTADQSTIPVLALDRDGNGEIEQIQAVILSPEVSDDVVPPTTQIDINNDNVVTISATDNPGGAGVFRTYYTTDGLTRSVYTEPFPLPPDAKIVMAYSEDRAGNMEYPGAVRPILGLSQSQIVMNMGPEIREPVLQTVDVINRDPNSLAGQLEWEALTDVPWLSVEPRAGMTPYSITLFVDITGLADEPPKSKIKGISGVTYETNVIIRSRTPGTVFAEQMLNVRVEISAGRQAQRE